jgi:hypothetical protein
MSRAERLSSGLALTKRLFEQVDKNDWDYIEVSTPSSFPTHWLIVNVGSTLKLCSARTRVSESTSTKSVSPPPPSPPSHHIDPRSFVAFQPVINSQGSDEQQAIWLPKCMNHEILGCYMQTELGHGSNVQRTSFSIASAESDIDSMVWADRVGDYRDV